MGYWNVNFVDGTSNDFGKIVDYVRESRFKFDGDGFLTLVSEPNHYAVALVPKSQIKYLEYIED